VALWGGRVLATGSDADIAPLIGPGTKVVDLRGQLLRVSGHLMPVADRSCPRHRSRYAR
jgi:hypothetical protein